ncbi:MAG TPA: diacylglycerol kinase family protein [Chloroflexota bacterium]
MARARRTARDKIVRAETKLARRTARLDRQEEERLRTVARRLDEARLLSLDPELAGSEQASIQRIWPRRRALLVINSKSGPKRDSLLQTRDIVDMLTAFNFQTEVRVKLRKAQARKEARRAAQRKFDVVIAAGGDGTVEAVARGLVDTRTALGILPLGTYNNVATCLGVPTDLPAACALIANFEARPIDVGVVEATGMDQPRVFLEMATVGLGAILTPVGQDLEKGRLSEAARTLPMVMNMTPSGMLLRLDGNEPPLWANSLLLTVSNAPRAGAALMLAPEARLDDGLLDVTLYDGLAQGDLATRLLALKTGTHTSDPRVRTARAMSIEVHTDRPMAVAADSKLVGITPVRFSVRAGALLAIAGRGPGLSRPATGVIPLPTLTSAIVAPPAPPLPDAPPPTLAQRAAANGQVPALARLATPAFAALVGAAAVPLLRVLRNRLERRH